MTLSLRGSSIPTDGSGRIVITDINPDGDNNELLCLSEISVSDNGDWYLHPTQQTAGASDKVYDDQGWRRNRAMITRLRRLVRLRRDDSIADGGRALEGVFTCHIPGDTNTPVSVGIYYPSELHVRDVPYYACMCLCIYSLSSGCHNQCAIIKTRNIHSDLHCQWWDCCEQFSHWTWRSGS